MNAKSLNHKADYSLRNLEFIITINNFPHDTTRCDYQIGTMLINFSDLSSKNNKTCGDAILNQILHEQSMWQSRSASRH